MTDDGTVVRVTVNTAIPVRDWNVAPLDDSSTVFHPAGRLMENESPEYVSRFEIFTSNIPVAVPRLPVPDPVVPIPVGAAVDGDAPVVIGADGEPVVGIGSTAVVDGAVVAICVAVCCAVVAIVVAAAVVVAADVGDVPPPPPLSVVAWVVLFPPPPLPPLLHPARRDTPAVASPAKTRRLCMIVFPTYAI